MAVLGFSSSCSLVSPSFSPLLVPSSYTHSASSFALPSSLSLATNCLPFPILLFSYSQNLRLLYRNELETISVSPNISRGRHISSTRSQCNAASTSVPHSATSYTSFRSQDTKFSFRPLVLTSTLSRVSSSGCISRNVPSGRTRHKQRLIGRAAKVYTVEMEHNGKIHVLEVAEDETILSKAIDAGLDVPYDCKLGVCMTCPAKLEHGEVDQSGGMLSEDVKEKGYALMCSSYPLSNCRIRSIPEDELLSLQLVTAAD